MRIGLGQAEGSETDLVTDAVIAVCRRQVGELRPQAGLVYASPLFDHALMLEKICDAFPGMLLVGCTSAGHYTSAYGFSDDSISLMVICDDEVQFGVGLGRGLREDYRLGVDMAYAEAKAGLSAPPSLCLAFPPGLLGSGELLLAYLNTRLPQGCTVFGGAASTLLTEVRETRGFCNREVVHDGLPLLLVAGPIRFGFRIANSWRPLGQKAKVTRAEGRLVYTIDGMRAVDFYRRYIGYHEHPVLEFLLVVYEPGATEHYIASPVEYYQDGAIRFSSFVPQGAKVRLTEIIRTDLLADTRITAQQLRSGTRDWQPAAALTFSCGFRKEVLGTRAEDELNVLCEVLPHGLPIMGSFSFGEIGPLTSGGPSKLQGATLILLLIGPGSAENYRDRTVELVKRENLVCGSPSCRIDYLKRRYHRSEAYRSRLEVLREASSRMHRRIMSDMLEAKQRLQDKEEELKKSEEKFRRIVQTTGEGFMLIDESMLIIDVNDAFCAMASRSRADVLGSLLWDLFAEEFQHTFQSHHDRLTADTSYRLETTLHNREGQSVPVLIHCDLLCDDQGEPIGEMAFLTDLTEQKKALALAGEVQRNLLPRESPKVSGLDIAGRNVSCEEVGGDYYDFFLQQEGGGSAFGVAVGDITGHGVDAALLMSSARAFLRLHVSQDNESLAEIVSAMNDHLAVDVMQSGRFMTLFYLSVRADLKSLEWVRAGHDPALLYDPLTDTFVELMGPGMALGVEPGYPFTVNSRAGLHDGHLLAIGTDGIWETCNIEGEMFGKKRFKKLLRAHAALPAADILEAVFVALEDFRAGKKADDDITLVLIKVQSK
ncbi:MAG: SpoIIE family protein phosphatase [Desulfopila sp.]